MKEQFVPYEIALTLKQKGFNEPCFACFYSKELTPVKEDDSTQKFNITYNSYEIVGVESHSYEISHIAAPLWQQVIDWFRDKHSINVGVYYHEDSPTCCAIIERFTENGLKLFTQPNGEELEFACVDRKFSKGELKKAIKHALTLI